MKKKKTTSSSIQNRRARFDYQLDDTYTVGLVLNGRETKSLRLGHGQLQGAYVTVRNNELWLVNCQIHGTKGIPLQEEEVTRDRKLLAKRREIDALIAAKQQGRTIVPLEILTKTKFIKIRISTAVGKKNTTSVKRSKSATKTEKHIA